MLIADIKGKLTLHEDVSEDFLTSSVFSTFDFLPDIWLRNYLKTSMNLNKNYLELPLANYKLIFWKQFPLPDPFKMGVEPDLLIIADNIILIVEAKFYSGKSGIGFEENNEGENQIESLLIDQIAREYFLGKNIVKEETFVINDKVFDIKDFFVILITKESFIPMKDIQDSIDAIEKIIPTESNIAKNKIFWTHWQKINSVLEEIIEHSTLESFESKISNQLIDFLNKRDLILFNGFNFTSPFSLVHLKKLKKPYFYHKEFKSYWSNNLFRTQLVYNESKLFYNPTQKH